jgi:hypothetical protein
MQTAARAFVRSLPVGARSLRTTAIPRAAAAAPASSNEVGKALEAYAATQTGEVCPFKAVGHLKTKGFDVQPNDVLHYLKAKDPEFVWWRFADETQWSYAPLPGTVRPATRNQRAFF